MTGWFAALLLATLATLTFAAQASPPKLLVVFTVDGLPPRHLDAVQAHLAPDGLRRFLDRGTVFAQAFHGHAHTVTCAGHATLATGAPPAVHGLVGNDWFDPAARRNRYCLKDDAHRVLGEGRGTAGTSPESMHADTLADALRRAHPQAKVLSVSGKDRGAIPAAGRAGPAYWYQTDTGRIASSSYYLRAHPEWVEAFNARRPADAFRTATWTPLLSEAQCAPCAADGSPWMAVPSFGTRLPAAMVDGARFYGDLAATPFGDQLLLDFALEAVRQEGLGQDRVPDLLAISLSAHDAIGHTFGPESRLTLDHLLQLDRLLQDFFRALDRQVGRGQWAAALSADHGFLDTPEWRRTQGLGGGRVASSALVAQLNDRLGPRTVLGVVAGGLSLDDPSRAAAVAEAARRLEPVRAACAPPDFAACAPFDDAVRQAWHPTNSPPVMLVLHEGWQFGSTPRGATHGSAHAYDRQVPLLFWGPRWVPEGRRVTRPVSTLDFAPSLAVVLGVAAPAQSEGRALPEALRMRTR